MPPCILLHRDRENYKNRRDIEMIWIVLLILAAVAFLLYACLWMSGAEDEEEQLREQNAGSFFRRNFPK